MNKYLLKKQFVFLIMVCVLFNLVTFPGIGGLFENKAFAADETPNSKIKVKFYNSTIDQYTDTIGLGFEVVNLNSTALNLNDVKLRYYFTSDGCSIIGIPDVLDFSNNGLSLSTTSVDASVKSIDSGENLYKADRYVEIGFKDSVLVAPYKRAFIRLNVKENSVDSDFDQSNDYSYNIRERFVFWSRTPAYVYDASEDANVLVWGSEPEEQPTPSASTLPINTPTPAASISPVPVFTPGVDLGLDITKDITMPTTLPVELFKPAEIGFAQAGTVNVATTPSKKEAIVLLDSTYASTKTTTEAIAPFGYCLFSMSDSVYQGSRVTINGSIFTRNNMKVDAASMTVSVDGDDTGSAEYSTRSGSGPSVIIEDPIKMETEEEYSRYDYLFEPDSDGAYSKLFDTIFSNANSVDPGDAETVFLDIRALNEVPFNLSGADSTRPRNMYFFDSFDSSVYAKYYQNGGRDGRSLFEINGSTLTLRADMFFAGDLKISVQNIEQELLPGFDSAFIYALGDIILEGNSASMSDSFKDVYLFSRKGNIHIKTGSANFTGVAFAPQGEITLNGNGNTSAAGDGEGGNLIQGSFIGQKVTVDPNSCTFIKPSDEQIKVIEDRIIDLEGFNTIKDTVSTLAYLFDDNTKAGVISYSDYAHVPDDWKLYDMSSQRSDFATYTQSLLVDQEDINNNLGDALRRAYHKFTNPSISDENAEKFIIIFTGLEPNASTDKVGFTPTDESQLQTEDGDPVHTSINGLSDDYVKKISGFIDDYNEGKTKGTIKLMFVDLSWYRTKDTSVSLASFANTYLGIDTSDGDFYYKPIDMDYIEGLGIVNDMSNVSNSVAPQLTAEKLKVKSAVFKAVLPAHVKPSKLLINGAEVPGSEYTNTPNDAGEHEISFDVKNYMDFSAPMDGGLYYDLETDKLFISIIVDNDESFTENTLTITGDVTIPAPQITYTLYEDLNESDEYEDTSGGDGDEYVLDPVLFDNVNFNIFYAKDIG